MPELPEIASRAAQMNAELTGKTITGIEILQPKSLNIPVEQFTAALTGATLRSTTHRGKWLVTDTTGGWLLINMGMGGEILLVTRATLPKKYRLIFDFTDGSCLAINFWWFGHVHYAPADGLDANPMLSKIGPNALTVTAADLRERFAKRKTRLKSYLLDQSEIAGIGNAYIHDILFLARLHPLRELSSLSAAEIDMLVQGIHQGLEPSLEKGGAFYEVDLHGKPGGFLMEDIIIGYREGKPCPVCGATIQKMKTGSSTSFICPTCQK